VEPIVQTDKVRLDLTESGSRVASIHNTQGQKTNVQKPKSLCAFKVLRQRASRHETEPPSCIVAASEPQSKNSSIRGQRASAAMQSGSAACRTPRRPCGVFRRSYTDASTNIYGTTTAPKRFHAVQRHERTAAQPLDQAAWS
jgi:hypothetical protein